MPYVKAHKRRSGARVRSHHRRRRSNVRRVARRRPASGSGAGGVWFIAAIAAVGIIGVVVDWIQRHPVVSTLLGVFLVAVLIASLAVAARMSSRRRAEQAQRDRLVALTDGMTGPQFEQWFARILAASGFHDVRVCGGSGDRGADILAKSPDGRRVVVQCKRQHLGNRVGSAAIQRFAGTCRSIHGGEICLLVTNSHFTAGDCQRLARELGIVLVDRTVLEMWAWSGQPPAGILS
ncbi:hypothetical protein GKC29_17395 [Micromonospora sp. WMMC415]|uniref:restriction endonuclease n=1 Tax=Micromonospora sp. WMMC415 TaxID=2675222 RepID=UPI0012B471D2|nr:restriction endonuclease [Micromonospora sp. WMMC415]QGN48439.1 hypothetical protein GKC29_17395 [Micromonospora sp. WMMC415]